MNVLRDPFFAIFFTILSESQCGFSIHSLLGLSILFNIDTKLLAYITKIGKQIVGVNSSK